MSFNFHSSNMTKVLTSNLSCQFCKRQFPFPHERFESMLMLRVVNVTQPVSQFSNYCLGDSDYYPKLEKLKTILEPDRFEELLKNAYLPGRTGCYEKNQEYLKKIAHIKWLRQERAKYAREHVIEEEEDYPEDLRMSDHSTIDEEDFMSNRSDYTNDDQD